VLYLAQGAFAISATLEKAMKRLHRPDLYCWSAFDTARNIDFHSYLWVRPDGNVVVDPLPLTSHDAAHLRELGGVETIVVTNSDHLRAAVALAESSGAVVVGPRAERDTLPCSRWLGDGDEVVPGMQVFALDGSKTPGELALLIGGTTLITGDLIRSHEGGRLCLLPEAKLTEPSAARASIRRLAALPEVEAVLPGDGWPVFRDGGRALRELVGALTPTVRFVGNSGSGKTTLVAALIEHWAGEGVRVAAVKHASKGFHMDRPGKDSFRFRNAGAVAVAVASPSESALIADHDGADTVEALIARLPAQVDVIVVEGYKRASGPLVEVRRGESAHVETGAGLLAIATDRPGGHPEKVPQLDLDDVPAIAAFLRRALAMPDRSVR